MRTHYKSHTIDFRWPCRYCEEKFKTLKRYKNHIAKLHSEKVKEIENSSAIRFYQCTACPKILIDKDHFEEHMNVHTGTKPHKCQYCGKGFCSKKNTVQHEKTHTGAQKLRCELCPKKYSDPAALKVHLKNKHNVNINSDEEDLWEKIIESSMVVKSKPLNGKELPVEVNILLKVGSVS